MRSRGGGTQLAAGGGGAGGGAVGCGVVVRRIFGLDFVMMLSRHGRVC